MAPTHDTNKCNNSDDNVWRGTKKKTLSRLQNKNHGKPSNVGQNIFFHTARTDWKEVLATYGSDK